MAMTHVVAVQVVAVHVECGRCGQFGRIEHNHPDGFTRHVLQPLASWWISHRDPQLVRLELSANGVLQQWALSRPPEHRPDERPNP